MKVKAPYPHAFVTHYNWAWGHTGYEGHSCPCGNWKWERPTGRNLTEGTCKGLAKVSFQRHVANLERQRPVNIFDGRAALQSDIAELERQYLDTFGKKASA